MFLYLFSLSVSNLIGIEYATKISSNDASRSFAKRVAGEDFMKRLENFNSVSDGNVQFFL